MATTIACAYLTLIDNFPGLPDLKAPEPLDGFTGASHFNVTVPTKYAPGTKMQVWDRVSGGPVTLCYLRNKTLGTAPAAAAAGTVAHPHTTQWEVSTDPDNTPVFALTNGQIAVALGVIALESYGFWWVGGVCPADPKYFTSSMAAVTVLTDDSVVIATPIMLVDTTADLGIKIFTGDVIPCGITRSAD